MRTLFSLLVVLFGVVAHAAPAAPHKWSKVPGLSASASRLELYRVKQQLTLVDKQKDSDGLGGGRLRVNLIVLDAGGSTDVSPRARLYLAIFRSAEMADGAALYDLGPMNELLSAERREARVYTAQIKRYSDNADEEYDEDLTLDAREASAKLGTLKGVEEGTFHHIVEPIKVARRRAAKP